MTQAGNFFSGLLQGFAQGQERQRDRKEREDEKKARVKLFEIQLEREQRANAAEIRREESLKKLMGQLEPQVSAATPGSAPTAAATPTLTELLADPKNSLLMLQSGVLKGDDLLKREDSAAQRAMLQKLLGGGAPGGMELQGVKVGPAGEIMPDFGLPPVTSPQVVQTPDGPRLQTFNPRSGKLQADLGASKEDSFTPEQAGRISGLAQAQRLVPIIRSGYVNEDGTVNRFNVFNASFKTPGTAGRKIRQDFDMAADAVIRARSGSGLNASELPELREQLLPSAGDTDAAVLSKMEKLEQFVNGALDVVTLSPRIRKLMDEEAPKGKEIDFNSLPP